jgi:hypothetical protein
MSRLLPPNAHEPALLVSWLGTLLGSATLGGALLLSLVLAPVSHAAINGCRSDPTFTLSDGAVIDVGVTISDKLADVKRIAFTMSIPTGTAVVSYAGSTLSSIETYSVNATMPARSYQTVTYVTTGTNGISVSATTTGKSKTGKGSVTEYGTNGQYLTAGLTF